MVAWVVFSSACAGATRVVTAPPAEGDGSASVAAAPSDPTDVGAPTTTSERVPIECVSQLSVEQKIGQTLMVLVSDPRDSADAVASGSVGGFGLIGGQSDTVGDGIGQVAALAPLPIFAAGDEEGGSVQRLRNVLGRLPSARDLATSSTPEEAAAVFGDYAEKMADLGLNMNLGPVVDVGTGSGLANRSFADDVDTVVAYSTAMVAAAEAAEVTPVAKHWPGLGSGDQDPHQGPVTVSDIDTLRSADLAVFDSLIAEGVPAIMVSHALVPGLTEDRPASLSSDAITGELRGRQGFDGVVMTDSLGMGAIAATLDNPTAAREAIVAGADIALLSGVAFVDDATSRIASAVEDGTLPMDQLDASVDRILRLKGVQGPCPLPPEG